MKTGRTAPKGTRYEDAAERLQKPKGHQVGELSGRCRAGGARDLPVVAVAHHLSPVAVFWRKDAVHPCDLPFVQKHALNPGPETISSHRFWVAIEVVLCDISHNQAIVSVVFV